MQRNIERLSTETFDVLIVGSGIYGATLARQCALQGLKVALIDKGDFGSATSANSLKIIHGGLRYLQSLDIKRMRQSINARRRLQIIAGDAVTPLPCVIATSKRFMRSRLVMGVALLLNNIISWDRNKGLSGCARIPNGRLLPRSKFKGIVSGIVESVTGAAYWHDVLVLDTERLILDFVQSAERKNACVANYVKAESMLVQKNRVTGVKARDIPGNKIITIKARQTIEACGPWSESTKSIKSDKNSSNALGWALAFNIIVRKQLFKDTAVGISAGTSSKTSEHDGADMGREFFFVPWRGSTIIGTAYQPFTGNVDDWKLSEQDIEKFIQQLNHLYPAAALSMQDVVFVQQGLLPAKAGQKAPTTDLLNQTLIINHEKDDGLACLTSVIGVKFTTALPVADIVAKETIKKLGLKYKKYSNEELLIEQEQEAGFSDSPLQQLVATLDIDSSTIETLQKKYGKHTREILKIIIDQPELAESLTNDPPLITAEIIYSIRNEMATNLSDIIFRRTGMGTAGQPEKELLEKVAALIAEEFNWSEERIEEEIKSVEAVFVYNE